MNLPQDKFDQLAAFIRQEARPLDQALFAYYFEQGTRESVLLELAKYQNPDGGFGHGLEPDFTTPSSSNQATCIALQYMEKVETPETKSILVGAIRYFASSYSEHLQRWRPVAPDVNHFPHAPWWHLDAHTGLCQIEQNWENPSVEILGYLAHYPGYFSAAELQLLIDRAGDQFFRYIGKMQSEHTLYCYLQFYRHTDRRWQGRMQSHLEELILATVHKNPPDWIQKYVATPLHFVSGPDDVFYGILTALVQQNLDVLISHLDSAETWFPTWQWAQYPEQWTKAKMEWAGKIAVENLVLLKKFDRL